MKVAVFTSSDEVIILAVKGRGRSVEDVDGYDEWFGPGNRDVREYDVRLCHIGTGAALQIQTRIQTDGERELDIEDWFYCVHCDEVGQCVCED